MEFIRAPELKKKFSVFGHFYKLKIDKTLFDCRSVLEIVPIGTSVDNLSKPCAVVVMMNPGSSAPMDKNYVEDELLTSDIISSSWSKELIPTNPDPAQYQIMRLMLLEGWNHVRILNLSDLRNPKSSSFLDDFCRANNLDSSNPHCITDPRRRPELLKYCNDVPYIIAGWGREKVLYESAENFLNAIGSVSGIDVGYPNYYYPSPPFHKYKIHWLESIQSTITPRNIKIACNWSLSYYGLRWFIPKTRCARPRGRQLMQDVKFFADLHYLCCNTM